MLKAPPTEDEGAAGEAAGQAAELAAGQAAERVGEAEQLEGEGEAPVQSDLSAVQEGHKDEPLGHKHGVPAPSEEEGHEPSTAVGEIEPAEAEAEEGLLEAPQVEEGKADTGEEEA